MVALLEAWLFTSCWIAAGVAVALIAGRLRSRPPVALGLTAVPVLGTALVPAFC